MRIQIAVAAIAACILVAGGAEARKAPTGRLPPSGSLITYSLPSTSLKVTVGLTLTRCVGGFAAKPEVTFTPSAGPTEHPEWRFSLDGRSLGSFWKSKKLSIETYPHGSIKSLNGGLSDQTGSILTSAIKIAATALALAPPANPPASLAGRCSPETVAAIDRVKAMTTRIKALRVQLSTAPAGSVESLTKTIDALAAEVARLQTNELHVDLSREFVMDPGLEGATMSWTSAAFAKWLPPGTAEFPVTDVAVGLCFRRAPTNQAEADLHCDSTQLNRASKSPAAVAPVVCADDPGCATTLVLREPVRASVLAFAVGGGFDGVADDAPLKKSDFMAAQWGEISFLPLRIGFGKSVNFAMGFDEYGHKLSQTWDTAARGTSILSTASTAADSLAGIIRTADGASLAEQKAEIDRINTEKALNQARFCKAVYDAGGFSCP